MGALDFDSHLLYFILFSFNHPQIIKQLNPNIKNKASFNPDMNGKASEKLVKITTNPDTSPDTSPNVSPNVSPDTSPNTSPHVSPSKISSLFLLKKLVEVIMQLTP